MLPRLRLPLVVAALVAATSLQALWLAPATLADAVVARLTGGALRVASSEGTIWRAQGDLVADSMRLPLAWHIEPWPLLRGELRLRLRPPVDESRERPRADVAIRGSRVTLRGVDISAPASFIAAATRFAGALTARGEVALTTAALDWNPPDNRGTVRLQWRAARVVLANGARVLDLGDISAMLGAEGARLSGPVSNEGGSITLRGTLDVRANDEAQLALTLSPRDPNDAGTVQWLSMIGAADVGGRRIDLRLPLR